MDFNQQVQNLIDSYNQKEFFELEDNLNQFSQKSILEALNDAVFGFYIQNVIVDSSLNLFGQV